MNTRVRVGAWIVLAIAATAIGSGGARASAVIDNFDATYYSVSGSSNSAFCGSLSSCDFRTPTGGTSPGTVPTPNLNTTTSGTPTVNSTTPGINGFNSTNHQVEWWSPGTYGTTSVNQTGTHAFGNTTLATGAHQLFSDPTFFPNNGNGGNDVGSSLTAKFTGTVVLTTAGTLTFTGSVDDNILIYLGQNGTYTLYPTNPEDLSNQAAYSFTDSISLAIGTYNLEVFYADRSSTQASLTLDAAFTAAVPEASTWAMMMLGFASVGFMAYRRKRGPAFRLA
jgi:hypothetical protein